VIAGAELYFFVNGIQDKMIWASDAFQQTFEQYSYNYCIATTYLIFLFQWWCISSQEIEGSSPLATGKQVFTEQIKPQMKMTHENVTVVIVVIIF